MTMIYKQITISILLTIPLLYFKYGHPLTIVFPGCLLLQGWSGVPKYFIILCVCCIWFKFYDNKMVKSPLILVILHLTQPKVANQQQQKDLLIKHNLFSSQ